jgi:hypothetical protein
MNATLCDELQATLARSGPAAAIGSLCDNLKENKEFHALFYALLMRKRHELGLSPIPTGSNQDLPAEVHATFEDAIRDAGRTVGQLFLADGNLPAAWAYFRMIGEATPVREVLDKTELGDGEDTQAIIEIAFHQGVHPRRGFDWILQRYGICNAITTIGGGGELPFGADVRNYCIERLVHVLHGELFARLKAEIEQKQGFPPSGKTIAELVEGRDWLFADDLYHIDLSHLNSVVQMSIQLDDAETLRLARDLCAYGKRLSTRFSPQTDPPFDQQYHDFDKYLAILTGEDVEGGLAHFRKKAEEADPHEIGTYPAEVLVNLLLRLNRNTEALATARKFLGHVADARLSCPNLVELCQRTNSYAALAEIAREQNNPVNYLAGLIGSRPARG